MLTHFIANFVNKSYFLISKLQDFRTSQNLSIIKFMSHNKQVPRALDCEMCHAKRGVMATDEFWCILRYQNSKLQNDQTEDNVASRICYYFDSFQFLYNHQCHLGDSWVHNYNGPIECCSCTVWHWAWPVEALFPGSTYTHTMPCVCTVWSANIKAPPSVRQGV